MAVSITPKSGFRIEDNLDSYEAIWESFVVQSGIKTRRAALSLSLKPIVKNQAGHATLAPYVEKMQAPCYSQSPLVLSEVKVRDPLCYLCTSMCIGGAKVHSRYYDSIEQNGGEQ